MRGRRLWKGFWDAFLNMTVSFSRISDIGTKSAALTKSQNSVFKKLTVPTARSIVFVKNIET